MPEHKENEQDLDFSELRKIDEYQFTMWTALNLYEELSREEPPIWGKVGENGGLVIQFDPELFLAALARVRLPERTTKPEEPKSKVEVAVFENLLRMRSQSAYITFEAEFPLNVPVSNLPAGGVAFLIRPSRLDPFFNPGALRSPGDLRRPRRRRHAGNGFGNFEYLADEGVLVLARKDSRLGLEVEVTTPSASLPKIDPDAATPLPSVKAFAQALRCAAYVTEGMNSRKHHPVAVFKDGQCTAAFKSRAAILANGEIAGVDLAVQLKTPLKLATMLGRLREPASLAIIDNQAVIDDGRLRCAFPVMPPVPPAIARDEQVLQCVNSTWTAGLDDLQYLSGVFNVIARRQSDILLSVSDEGSNTVLKSVMDESDGNARLEFDLVALQPVEPADAEAYRDARVKFRDLEKVIERLTGHRPTIAINSTAVIITDVTENSRHEYFIGRR